MNKWDVSNTEYSFQNKQGNVKEWVPEANIRRQQPKRWGEPHLTVSS
ncbi:hypothetical protein F4826_000617 [Rahnella inusitata]|nr:hypothetical protein [Rahnella inusitata]